MVLLVLIQLSLLRNKIKMTNYERIDSNSIVFNVDLRIYPDIVISKALYWLAGAFIIERSSINDYVQRIVLEKKDSILSKEDFVELKIKLNQDFTDFKLRSIIDVQTQNIRDILYVKAFADNDDFEDYNLTD